MIENDAHGDGVGAKMVTIYGRKDEEDIFSVENAHAKSERLGKRDKVKKHLNKYHRGDSHPAPNEPERFTEEHLANMEPPPVPKVFTSSVGEEEDDDRL